jgi:hypothetical protein
MHLSRPRLAGLPAVLATTLLTIAACSPDHSTSTSGASPDTSSARFTVTSTLDGLTTLPHRISWQAFPRPDASVTEVDFLIDGKQFWVEHNPPYFYGSDGNYLVTSFLAPGPHAFTVRAIEADGHTASDTVTASVPTAPRPPGALAGTWKGFVKRMSPNSCNPGPCPPAGYWRLVISPTGWQVYDTSGGGGLYDVLYQSHGLAEIRTGMAAGHPNTDGNAWCNNAPGSPVRVKWAVRGNLLSFTPVGNQAASCGFTAFLRFRNGHRAVSWTKVGS